MWDTYGRGNEAVAIKSTIRALSGCIFCDERFSAIGRVQYIDFKTYEMGHYEAGQAIERAFLKALEFSSEQEVRIASLNFRGPDCVNPDGTDIRPEQYQGPKMSNLENSGLHVRADLRRMIDGTVIAPGAPEWFELLVKRLAQLSGVGEPYCDQPWIRPEPSG